MYVSVMCVSVMGVSVMFFFVMGVSVMGFSVMGVSAVFRCSSIHPDQSERGVRH